MKRTVLVLALALGAMGWGSGFVFAQLGGETGNDSAKAMVGKAKAALKVGKLEMAFAWFMKAAKKENPEAQNMVGKCYENGIGVRENDMDAAVWYRKSAGYGYAEGQNNLGNCYLHGKGVRKDDQEAIKYYHKAASKGSTAAAYNLGYCYETGYGLPRNSGMAKYFYHMAAAEGNTLAQSRLRQIER